MIYESQPAELLDNSKWEEVRQSVIKHYIQPEKLNIVSDQQLIQRQSDLMEEIKQKIHRSRFKQPFGSMQILPIDSSLSNISSAYNYGDEESLIKSKFTQEFESSLVNSALKQVRANCSEQTYETVRNYIINNKQKECQNLIRSNDKKNKEIQELQLNVILKQNQIVRLKQQVASYMEKMETLQSEKKRWKLKNDQITEKEKRIHKAQMALIFKEKMHQQAKKRSERLKQFTDGLHSKIRSIENQLNNTWNKILKGMEKSQSNQCCADPDPKGCWKQELMKKCRQKILEQRNLLKQQQKQLQKEYQVMENISQQCKRLVSDTQQGLIQTGSHINNGGNSAINPGTEDKITKVAPFSLIQPQIKKYQNYD